MNLLLPIALIAGGFGISHLLRVGDAANRLMQDITGIKFRGIRNGNVLFDLNLQATNPSSKTLFLDYIFLDITLPNGTQLGKIRQEKSDLGQQYPITGNRTTNIAMPLQIPLTSLLFTGGKTLLDLVTTGKLPDAVKIDGEIKVSGIASQFNKSIPLSKAS